ncbi:hypothetical protein H8356DRAFT_950283 [Neocallimastix lanati (nom. inval.)]|uniref:Uncharacterized protein n=1 Tax=Neocallimastix californiae TaxID=1754190 RepID=A0A1Y2AU94_9FUNG|nr:hypothetical protein H8356DRAFT_950283 [Neocallimastix sp. JGI-2020a]ORY25505.1 hypothetical protein LY90DRAFT_109625 [Neocallimastix californiae]|eukprot:ORY25505.1 hypothetical protein LY90DRAFT_109625 [Neocallimastix californiae]
MLFYPLYLFQYTIITISVSSSSSSGSIRIILISISFSISFITVALFFFFLYTIQFIINSTTGLIHFKMETIVDFFKFLFPIIIITLTISIPATLAGKLKPMVLNI